MASGRQDYWGGVVAVRVVEGSGQEGLSIFSKKELEGGMSVDIVSYTVPEGYEVSIASIMVTVDGPGYHFVEVYVREALMTRQYFDSEQMILFGESSAIKVESGDEVRVRATNNDDLDYVFTALISGFRKRK